MKIISEFTQEDIDALYKETGGADISFAEPVKFLDLCTQSGLSESNGEAKKLIQSGSLYCNEEKVDDLQYIVNKEQLVNKILLLRKGKKVFKVIKMK